MSMKCLVFIISFIIFISIIEVTLAQCMFPMEIIKIQYVVNESNRNYIDVRCSIYAYPSRNNMNMNAEFIMGLHHPPRIYKVFISKNGFYTYCKHRTIPFCKIWWFASITVWFTFVEFFTKDYGKSDSLFWFSHIFFGNLKYLLQICSKKNLMFAKWTLTKSL